MSWLSSFLGDLTGSNATNRAVDIQQQTAADSNELLREFYYDGIARQEPWQNALADFMGVERAQPVNALAFGADGSRAQPGDPNYSSYVSGYGDLKRAYNALSPQDSNYIIGQGFDADKNGRISDAEYGQFHFTTHGEGEGRNLPTFAAPQANPSVASGSQQGGGSATSEPYDYRSSPLWTSMLETTADDMKRYSAAAVAAGTAFSGSHLIALNDINKRNSNAAAGQVWNALNGGNITTSNHAQQGNALATNLANINGNLGNQMASSYLRQGENTSRLYGNLIGTAASFF